MEDREQLIYDLRRFADQSLYLIEINKIGANEIINFLLDKIKPSLEQEKHSYAARFAEWVAANKYTRVISDSILHGKVEEWIKQGSTLSFTTSQLLSLFNEQEAKQDKIEKK